MKAKIAYLLFFLINFHQVALSQEIERKANFPKKAEFPQEVPPASRIWVFVMAGQSNMAGRGFVEPQDTMPNQRILSVNSNGDLVVAKEPLHFYEPTMTGLDCGVSFAQTLLRFIPDSISVLMLPTAVGGSAIDQWLGDSVHRNVKLLTNFKQKVKLAQKYGTVKGIIWHQGESDSKPALLGTYEEKLRSLFEQFREYIGDPNLPVIFGEIGLFSEDPSQKVLMNQTLHRFAQNNPNVSCISTGDFKHKGDKLHFDSQSQRAMGKRMALAYLRMVKSPHLFDLLLNGYYKPRPDTSIESSNRMIRSKTIDRDLADYDFYKEGFAPLGVKLFHVQAGWDKNEKVKDWQSISFKRVPVYDAPILIADKSLIKISN